MVYFPGSTIGNLTPEEAHAFLSMSRGFARRMLIGVDLKKDPALLHAAYNDAAGVTAAFNLNLLARINRELGADFELRRLRTTRSTTRRRAASRCTSSRWKSRWSGSAGTACVSPRARRIHTENSCKYSPEGFRALAGKAGWRCAQAWTDRRALFALFGLSA